MKPVLFCVLGAVTAAHITSLFFRRRWSTALRALTKACLVPLILAVYASGAERMFLPAAAALVFGWLGDIMLLKTGIRFFTLGLVMFLLGHLSYAFTMFYFARPLHAAALAASVPAAFVLGLLVHRIIRPGENMKFPSLAYEAAILLMGLGAFQLFLDRPAAPGALVLGGAVSFMVSDTLLAYFAFHRRPRYGNVPVMITYIAAQLCIALGLSGIAPP
ncbi:MAG: lysoplasmalogenase [Treponema sp.]|nr:lysoplasmalogenase [Treponema sp.]